MRALLDISVLIALLDSGHTRHGSARSWLAGHHGGWASCPLTQNGCARVMSLPAYPNTVTTSAVIERLHAATQHPSHEFWPDDVSILDPQITRRDALLGPRQLTDIYLLALAVRHSGVFVTLDSRIAFDAVIGASSQSLSVL
ncbi:MAG: TA system VapC family ribonuclease toxin [Myxococcota bacterium]